MNKVMMSKERKEYLKKIRQKKYLVLFTQVAILVAFLGLWEWMANENIIDSFIASQPSRIAETFMNLTSNDLLRHIGVTTYETVVGFLLGTFLGIVIAILLWWSDFLSRVAEPYLVVSNSLPKVALRTYYNHMGWGRYSSNHNYGNNDFFNSYHIRKLKWIYENR